MLAKRLWSTNSEQEEQVFVIDPESSHYRMWLSLMCILTFWSSSECTFTIAFFEAYSRYYALLPLTYLIDVCFAINVLIHFRTGYFESSSGAKVLERTRIMRHYARSVRGVAEVAAALPLDLLQLAIGWTPFVRVLKVLRLYSMPLHLRTLSETSVTPRAINLITIVKMGFSWLVLSHSAACSERRGFATLLPQGAAPLAHPEPSRHLCCTFDSRLSQSAFSLLWRKATATLRTATVGTSTLRCGTRGQAHSTCTRCTFAWA